MMCQGKQGTFLHKQKRQHFKYKRDFFSVAMWNTFMITFFQMQKYWLILMHFIVCALLRSSTLLSYCLCKNICSDCKQSQLKGRKCSLQSNPICLMASSVIHPVYLSNPAHLALCTWDNSSWKCNKTLEQTIYLFYVQDREAPTAAFNWNTSLTVESNPNKQTNESPGKRAELRHQVNMTLKHYIWDRGKPTQSVLLMFVVVLMMTLWILVWVFGEPQSWYSSYIDRSRVWKRIQRWSSLEQCSELALQSHPA